MLVEYERQLEQQNEQLQQKLADMEKSFNLRLMDQSREAMDDAYDHYNKMHKGIFCIIGIIVITLITCLVIMSSRVEELKKQLDAAAPQKVEQPK